MTNLTKHTLEQTLNRIYETIKKATQEDYEENNWYSDLLWQDELEDYFENGKGMNIEDTLAIDAVQYPELYPRQSTICGLYLYELRAKKRYGNVRGQIDVADDRRRKDRAVEPSCCFRFRYGRISGRR